MAGRASCVVELCMGVERRKLGDSEGSGLTAKSTTCRCGSTVMLSHPTGGLVLPIHGLQSFWKFLEGKNGCVGPRVGGKPVAMQGPASPAK